MKVPSRLFSLLLLPALTLCAPGQSSSTPSISIQPASGAPTLVLGNSLAGLATTPAGFSLSYSTDGTGSGWDYSISRLHHPNASYLFNFTGAENQEIFGAELSAGNLCLADPGTGNISIIISAQSTWEEEGINYSAPGVIYIDGSPVLTAATGLSTSSDKWAMGAGSSVVPPGSFAFGEGIIINNSNHRIVVGQFNDPSMPDAVPGVPWWNDSRVSVFTVGNGTTATRQNALTVHRSGVTTFSSGVEIGQGRIGPDASQALVAGNGSQAHGSTVIAFGLGSLASGESTSAIGAYNTAESWAATAFGQGTRASAAFSLVAGLNSRASAPYAFAAGSHSLAAKEASVALGSAVAQGAYSLSAGVGTQTRSYGQVAVGRFNNLPPNRDDYSEVGPVADAEPLFMVGNGSGLPTYPSNNSPVARSNAFEVRNNGDVSVKGVLRVEPAGGISMGAFTDGAHPF